MNDPHAGDEVIELELTTAERDAFQRLARERPPSALLEARVLVDLTAHGVLRRAGRSGGGGYRGFPRRTVPTWAAAAAGFFLLLSGALAGHRLGADATARAFLEVREQDLALRVQEVGSAYVRSLLSLEALAEGSRGDPDPRHGREIATTTFHAAARVMARLDPTDPVAPALVEMLEGRLFGRGSDQSESPRTFTF